MTALFSIKPKYAGLIFSRKKTVELRRIFPRRVVKGSHIIFWESSPSKRLAGIARVKCVVKTPTEVLWKMTRGIAAVSREEFDDYFEGAEEGVALFLEKAMEFKRKPELQLLRKSLQFQPPQSFRYLSPKEKHLILELTS